ncbi:MAG: hypothetical protein J6D37_06300 [Clostridia bacterium]|nr:hypothetical protein [Clostridia bacterium]
MGHLITTYVLKKEAPMISVERYGDVCGLVTLGEKSERKEELLKRSELEDELTICLGGLASEKVIMNDMTVGSTSDIDKAGGLIRAALVSGLFGLEYYQLGYTGSEYRDDIYVNQEHEARIANLTTKLMTEAFDRAVQIIQENVHIYHKLAPELKREGMLSSERVQELLEQDDAPEQKEAV